MPAAYPSGSIASHIILAKVSSLATTVTLSYDDDCAKNVLDSLIKKELKLSAYLVTTLEGYPDNGVMFMRTGAIPGHTRLFPATLQSSMVDSWRPNHDRVQAVTAVERFCRQRVAAYPLHTREFCVS